MSLHSRDPILLTPGPADDLARRPRSAMLRDWGSWDAAFNARDRRRARASSSTIVHGAGHARLRADAGQRHVLGRGGGQHAGAARRPRAGADQRRLRQAAWRSSRAMMGRRVSTFETADDVPTTAAGRRPAARRATRRSRTSASSTARRRPASSIRCRRSPRSSRATARSLIVDAMSSFGALPIDARDDAVRRADRGVGQVRRGAARAWASCSSAASVLERCAGNSTSLALDLHDQWTYMEKTTQWRYTPPTHVVVAFDAALDQFVGRGRAAGAARALHARTARRWSPGMARARASARSSTRRSRRRSSSRSTRRPTRRTRSSAFYDRVRDKGFVLYPGKLTQVETFRVGCIGAIGPDEMRHAVNAVRDTLARDGHPAGRAGAAPRARRA